MMLNNSKGHGYITTLSQVQHRDKPIGVSRLGLLVCGFAALLISACTANDQGDLKAYVEQIQARKAERIAPLPEVKSYESYAYQAEGLRDPFKPGKEEASVEAGAGSSGLQPDVTRNKEPLEGFALDALRYVGQLEQDGNVWAIITAPDGFVYRVQSGNYIGQNFGRITAINEGEIVIKEILPNGLGGWVERDATLSLTE